MEPDSVVFILLAVLLALASGSLLREYLKEEKKEGLGSALTAGVIALGLAFVSGWWQAEGRMAGPGEIHEGFTYQLVHCGKYVENGETKDFSILREPNGKVRFFRLYCSGRQQGEFYEGLPGDLSLTPIH